MSDRKGGGAARHLKELRRVCDELIAAATGLHGVSLRGRFVSKLAIERELAHRGYALEHLDHTGWIATEHTLPRTRSAP